jgi:hypothetical protein
VPSASAVEGLKSELREAGRELGLLRAAAEAGAKDLQAKVGGTAVCRGGGVGAVGPAAARQALLTFAAASRSGRETEPCNSDAILLFALHPPRRAQDGELAAAAAERGCLESSLAEAQYAAEAALSDLDDARAEAAEAKVRLGWGAPWLGACRNVKAPLLCSCLQRWLLP